MTENDAPLTADETARLLELGETVRDALVACPVCEAGVETGTLRHLVDGAGHAYLPYVTWTATSDASDRLTL